MIKQVGLDEVADVVAQRQNCGLTVDSLQDLSPAQGRHELDLP
jgi:hypothetical protein